MIEQKNQEQMNALEFGGEVIIINYRFYDKRLETIEKVSINRAGITLCRGKNHNGKTGLKVNLGELGRSPIILPTQMLETQLEKNQRLRQARLSFDEVFGAMKQVDDPAIIEAAVSALESILRTKVAP